ncbi:hypothetical protein MBOL_15130 [Mycobacteroides abscessus subsp. bolletii BD]|nr:hypothetical protein MBOL_15130 [Mycobacteroides abscessus subsp. bolletii BD]
MIGRPIFLGVDGIARLDPAGDRFHRCLRARAACDVVALVDGAYSRCAPQPATSKIRANMLQTRTR